MDQVPSIRDHPFSLLTFGKRKTSTIIVKGEVPLSSLQSTLLSLTSIYSSSKWGLFSLTDFTNSYCMNTMQQGYGDQGINRRAWVPTLQYRQEVKVKSLSRVQLCDPMDCSQPGFSIHGIFQARVLEWVAISFSRGSSRPRDWTQVSCIAGRHFTIWATREVPGRNKQ